MYSLYYWDESFVNVKLKLFQTQQFTNVMPAASLVVMHHASNNNMQTWYVRNLNLALSLSSVLHSLQPFSDYLH